MQENFGNLSIDSLLNGKKGLICGVANKMSVAWAIAQACSASGAKLALSYQDQALKTRVAPLAQELNCDFVVECNVKDDSSVENMFNQVQQHWGELDFLVHSIAFADRKDLQGRYVDTSREGFLLALEVSCYSLTLMSKFAEKLMKKGGSIITLSYYGSEKVMPSYNVMGVAKAALESSVRYLASDLGPKIKVNAISAGPMRTLAASAIGDFKTMLDIHAKTSPLKRNTSTDDVARSSVYFLSDLSQGVTGQIHYVDCGYNIMGISKNV